MYTLITYEVRNSAGAWKQETMSIDGFEELDEVLEALQRNGHNIVDITRREYEV